MSEYQRGYDDGHGDALATTPNPGNHPVGGEPYRLSVCEVAEGGDCPDLDAIGADLRTMAGWAERINAGEAEMPDDFPTILADLAEAVERWSEVVA